MRSADMILERVKVREVAGIFRSWEQSDAALGALLSSGIDRADVDLTTAEEARARLGIDIPAEELPEVPGIPRRPVVRREDLLILGGFRSEWRHLPAPPWAPSASSHRAEAPRRLF